MAIRHLVPLRFTAVIHGLAMNYCVDAPTEMGGAFGDGTCVPVEAPQMASRKPTM